MFVLVTGQLTVDQLDCSHFTWQREKSI